MTLSNTYIAQDVLCTLIGHNYLVKCKCNILADCINLH